LNSSLTLDAWMIGGLLAAGIFLSADARAQPVTNEHSAADVTMARQLGNQGLELAAAGDCAAAVEPLARSEAMHHAPTTLAILGECHIAVGKLVEGVEELTRVVRENLDDQSPASFRAAQDRARVRLDEARPRLPKMRVVVVGAAANTGLTVRVDGEPIPIASLGLDRPVDPGHHRVDATASGYKQASGELTLAEGETRALSIELERLPEALATATDAPEGGSITGPSPVTIPSQGPIDRTPAYVAFGIGAASIVTGTGFGIFTLSKTSSLDKLCPSSSTCPPSAKGDIDLAKTTAWISNISLGVGAAALLAGLYFALRGHTSDRASTARNAATSNATIHPRIVVGSAGLEGSF
jgi:hypothetical protein